MKKHWGRIEYGLYSEQWSFGGMVGLIEKTGGVYKHQVLDFI